MELHNVKKDNITTLKPLQVTFDTVYPNASKLIQKFEGLSLKGYICSGNVATIGWGNTSLLKEKNIKTKDEAKKVIITKAEAEQLFEKDFKKFFNEVLLLVKDFNLNPNQVGALISFAFNLGTQALAKSTLLKRIQENPNNLKEIENEFLKWVNAGGKKLNGLVKRRKEEFNLYCQ